MDDLKLWKDQARESQESHAICFSDRVWDGYSYPDDLAHLEKVITILLYGLGRHAGNNHGLTSEEKKQVDDLKEKCVKHNIDKTQICLGKLFVFVYIDKEKQLECPLIRVRSLADSGLDNISKNKFIDHLGRVYTDWNKYLKENSWNEAWICVPKDGFYRPDLEVQFLDQTSRGRLSGQLDALSGRVSSCTTTGLLAGILMTMHPTIRPLGTITMVVSELLSAPSQIYDFLRNAYRIRDRSRHEQSLTDTEAMAAWWATLENFMSIFVAGADKFLTRSAESGRLVYKTARYTLTVVKYTNLYVIRLGVVKLIRELSEKPNIEPLDVWQVVASSLIFVHSYMTFETANEVIRNAQQRKINSLREKLTAKAQKRFDDHFENTKKSPGARCPLEANMIFIKKLEKIENLEDFYQKFDEY